MSKMFRIAIVFVVLSMIVGCSNDTEDVPDIGEEVFDDIAEDTVDTIKAGASIACKACLLVEEAENCTGVCATTVLTDTVE